MGTRRELAGRELGCSRHGELALRAQQAPRYEHDRARRKVSPVDFSWLPSFPVLSTTTWFWTTMLIPVLHEVATERDAVLGWPRRWTATSSGSLRARGAPGKGCRAHRADVAM